MKKILLISSIPPPIGGIAKWTQRMLNIKLPKGWTIELIDDKIKGKRESFGDKISYNYFDELKRWYRVWTTLYKKVREKDALVVHACPIATIPSMFVNYISASLVKSNKKKHIIHFRCTVPNLVKTRLQLRLMKMLCKKSDLIICLNNQSKLFLENNTQTPVVLIPNFINYDEMGFLNRKYEGGVKNILYVGGVTKEKGCDNIIKVANNFPSISFNLVGLASSEIKNLANNSNNIVFKGELQGQDLKKEYENADAFMFLSRFWGEGFSNAVAEAMAAGLPCIVTDWAANADQIDDTRGGYVVKDDVVGESIMAIEKLSDPNIRKSMSIYNFEKVHSLYSSEIIIKQYVDCYEKLNYGR